MVEPHKNAPREREKPEPRETNAGIPRYIRLLVVVAVVWGAGYILINPYQREFAPEPAAVAGAVQLQVDGEQIYNNQCAACHQATGLGLPGVFPPLSRSKWVTSDSQTPVRILLHGLSGEITVAGAQYNGMMPPFGSTLKDVEIAAVISYIRSAWDNGAPPVNVQTVTSVRETHADRVAPWTAQELSTLMNKP